jgi:hypothetical protein
VGSEVFHDNLLPSGAGWLLGVAAQVIGSILVTAQAVLEGVPYPFGEGRYAVCGIFPHSAQRAAGNDGGDQHDKLFCGF